MTDVGECDICNYVYLAQRLKGPVGGPDGTEEPFESQQDRYIYNCFVVL